MHLQSRFRPAWWLRNPHLQTLWPHLLRRTPRVPTRRERLELPDGDFLDLDWTQGGSGPIVLILHGLEGSARSHYARGMLGAIAARGWRGLVMHFRGCSGEPNRLARSYHSGETGDLAYVVGTVRRHEPDVPLAVTGYSLGGNVLLKWLGEMGAQAPITAAVAVSVPFELAKAAARLQRGVSRVYQAKLLRSLQRNTARKFSAIPCPVALEQVRRTWTLRQFDDLVTAPLHGFASADDYYVRCSSRGYIAGIRVPTLVLHALDDPFMTPDAVPRPEEVPAAVTLEVSTHGGHVGFVAGSRPWAPRFWIEHRATAFLAEQLDTCRLPHFADPRQLR
jgi:predicted alpha/beta-fold hydrolase